MASANANTIDFDNEDDLMPSMEEYELTNVVLDHEALFGEKCVESPFLADSLSDKLFREQFDSESNAFPFEFNETLPNTVGRHVRSFNLKQQKLNKPAYIDHSKKPRQHRLTDETRSRYDGIINKYDGLLAKLRLNEQSLLSLIMKPEMVDVFPVLLNKFTIGETPILDDTWMMNPRFVPSAIFDIMRKKGHFRGFSESTQDKILYLPNKNGKPVPVKYLNNYERENIIRTYMVKHSNDEDLQPVFSNLRHYNFPIFYVSDLKRFYDYDTPLHKMALVHYESFKLKSFGEIKDDVYNKMMASKLFRFNFEDKNKEFMYFSSGFRSSYSRFIDLICKRKECFNKDQISITFITPDKDFNDVSVTGAIDAICKYSPATRIRVLFVSNMVNFGEYQPIVKDGRIITVSIKSTTDFTLHISQFLKLSDVFFVDFTEIHQVGSMVHGTHGKLNKLMNIIVNDHIDVILFKSFFIRTSFSGDLQYFLKSVDPFIQFFKAGGMTFQFVASFSSQKFNFDKNLDLLKKIASIKLMTDDDRKKILMRGFGLKYLDRDNPIDDPLGFDLDCPKFNIANRVIQPLSYCHSRATYKFTKRKDDLLQYYVDLRLEHDREEGRFLKKIANALIRTNFSAADALADMRQNYPAENTTETLVRKAMQTVFRTNACDESLLRAIRMTLVNGQSLSKLKKTCKEIDKHLHLFYKYGDSKDESDNLYVFCGFVPENMNNPDVLVTFFPDVKDDTFYKNVIPEVPEPLEDRFIYDPVSPKRTFDSDEEIPKKKK